MRPTSIRALLSVALVIAAGGAGAQESQRYSLQGFGGWTYAKTDVDNDFGYVASEDGDWNNYYFALNVAARPLEKLQVRAQAFWGQDQRGERTRLDYVFAQWAQSPEFKLRVGKAPVPFGIYSEVYDVGTVRPFYLLPQFYEGPLGLIPKAYAGVGVTGVRALGEDWELQYDAFGGEIRFEPFSTDLVSGFDPSTGMPQVRTIDSQLVGREMVGGRLLLAAPSKGIDVGGTVFHAGEIKQRIGDGELGPYSVTESATFVNARVQYQKGSFAARAEFFEAFARDADVRDFYVEGSYKLGPHWQLAAQYEKGDILLNPGDESVPAPIREHESFGLALNYWVSPEFVLKLNAYAIDGNMIARPTAAGLRAALGTIEGSTQVVVLGAQFSF